MNALNPVPFQHPERPDYLCQELPGGGFLGWPASSQPSINVKHIDGPLLFARNGEMHWLTLWERFLLWRGRVSAHSLERKHWPWLQEVRAPSVHGDYR